MYFVLELQPWFPEIDALRLKLFSQDNRRKNRSQSFVIAKMKKVVRAGGEGEGIVQTILIVNCVSVTSVPEV